MVLEMYYSHWKFDSLHTNPLFGPPDDAINYFGAKSAEEIIDKDQGWRLVASLFLHCGLLHIGFNLLQFLRTSVSLEQAFGWHRIITICFLGGVFGELLSTMMAPKNLGVGGKISFPFRGVPIRHSIFRNISSPILLRKMTNMFEDFFFPVF
jgi:membrane associated rhomboid family serine protease